MFRTRSLILAVPALVVAVLGAAPCRSAQATSKPASRGAQTLDTVETSIFEQINQVRRQNGAPPLKKNEKLMQIARGYSERMAKERFFGHVDPQGHTFADRVEAVGLLGERLGENILKHSDPPDPAGVAVKGWLNSKEHRETLLTPEFAETGIGVWREGKAYYFTQCFFKGEKVRILP